MVSFFDPTIIVPYRCVDELKSLPDSQLSLNGNQYTRFAGSFTNSGYVSPALTQSTKSDLPRELDTILPTIQEEIQHAIEQVLPHSNDWGRIDVERDLVQVRRRLLRG